MFYKREKIKREIFSLSVLNDENSVLFKTIIMNYYQTQKTYGLRKTKNPKHFKKPRFSTSKTDYPEDLIYCKDTLIKPFLYQGFPKKSISQINNKLKIRIDYGLDYFWNNGIFIEIDGPSKQSKKSLYKYRIYDEITSVHLTEKARRNITKTYQGAFNVAAFLALKYLKREGVKEPLKNLQIYSKPLKSDLSKLFHRLPIEKYPETNYEAIRLLQEKFNIRIAFLSKSHSIGIHDKYKWVISYPDPFTSNQETGDCNETLLQAIESALLAAYSIASCSISSHSYAILQ